MSRAIGLVALGVLAPMLQGALYAFVPARLCPDLGLLLVVALGLVWRSAASGLLLAAVLGYLTDLLSGSLLGLHALLRVLAFGLARATSQQLNLLGPLPQVVFVAGLTAANGFATGALTAFFAAQPELGAIGARDLRPQIFVNAACAPFVTAAVVRVAAWLGEDEGGRRPLRLEGRLRKWPA